MKKIIELTLVLIVAILFFAPCVSDAYIEDTDIKINDLYYRVLSEDNKTVEITGIYNSEFKKNVDVPRNIEIDNTTYTVTSIGEGAFYYCDTLTQITLPNTIINIKKRAFYECAGLTNINIPNSVTSIGEQTFESCTSLESITLPNTITSISTGTFSYCDKLKNITLPNSIKSIGEQVFSNCRSLTSVKLPNSIESIGERAFSGCNGLTSINLPNSLTSIEEWAFSSCSKLTSINIPESITQINGDTFFWCHNLENVTIPKSVQAIAINAFEGCEKLMINTYSGAYAETFAKENNIPYKLLDKVDEDIVNIKDSKLKAELLSYDTNKDGELSKNEMQNITYLYIDNKGITDLTGLEHAINLENLSLDNNNITDISALANLRALKYLTIIDTDISDISALKNLTSLESLWLTNNNITDISPIANLYNLEYLRADDNKISNISCLKNLKNIKYLFLSDNNIADISVISNLNNIVTLDMSYNNIKDIIAIANLPKLIDIYFSNNQITDISTIPADRIINSVIIEAPNILGCDLEELGVCIENNYIDFTKDGNKQILEKFIKAQEKWKEQGATDVDFILDMVFRYTPQKIEEPITKPIETENQLVQFAFTNREDKITIKDLKNNSQFNVTKFNEKDVPSENTIVCTGDTFESNGITYTVVIYGDVDKNGEIDVFDALAIQENVFTDNLDIAQKVAGNVISPNDTDIDVFDALAIQEYVGGARDVVIDSI